MRERATLGVLAFAAIGLLPHCGGDGTVGMMTPPPDATAATFTEIQNEIFTVRCTLCHIEPGAPQGLDLSKGAAYASIVGVASTEIDVYERVAPGDPSSSYLVMKIEGDPRIVGERMPYGGPYLDATEIARVRSWIAAGALNN